MASKHDLRSGAVAIETESDAARAVELVEELERTIDEIDLRRDKEVAKIKRRAARMKERRTEQLNAVHALLERYHASLGTKKKLEVANGTIGWEKNRETLEYTRSEQEILNYLIRNKKRFGCFLKVEYSILKQPMHQYKELATKIPGVTFVQYEEFKVKPNRLQRFPRNITERIKRRVT